MQRAASTLLVSENLPIVRIKSHIIELIVTFKLFEGLFIELYLHRTRLVFITASIRLLQATEITHSYDPYDPRY